MLKIGQLMPALMRIAKAENLKLSKLLDFKKAVTKLQYQQAYIDPVLFSQISKQVELSTILS